MGAIDIPKFADSQLLLLAAELAAETASTSSLLASTSPATLARAGLAVINLSLSSQRTGLGGKTVLELEQDHAFGTDGEIGDHAIRVGDIVRVGEQPKGGEKKKEKSALESKGADGVVVRVSNKGLQLALEEGKGEDEGLMGRLWVVKLANDVTYKRMNQSMDGLQKMEEREYSTLTRILFGLDSPTKVSEKSADWPRDLSFFDATLNDSQKDAIRFALASREVALIHGPPGTGKTYTLIELIRQLLDRKLRVLVCGSSNISVDNIVERLAPHKLPIIRLGHPARLLPSVLNHSLDMLTQTSDAASIVKDIRKEMDAKQASIKKTRNGRERKAIYNEMKDLRKEYRERERQCVSTLLRGSKVVLATLHGAGSYQLRNENFDVVIIDEASQALEAQCWIPLLTAKKVVLAGDHLQLPPTIKSTTHKVSIPPSSSSTSKQKQPSNSKATPSKPAPDPNSSAPTPSSLETTLFDRLLSLHGSSIKRMLTTQYRMNKLIMAFPSRTLYSSKLIAAPSVANRLLRGLPYGVKQTPDTSEAVIFFDTQGGDFPESLGPADTTTSGSSNSAKSLLAADSKSNANEALLALQHATSLITDAGVHEADVAVITPYSAQVSLLASLFHPRFPGVELGTVDGFQGREKDAIILSLVRSNLDASSGGGGGGGGNQGEVGFLAEKRRLNVAMTRPRRQLCVIGDSETLRGGGGKGGGNFLGRWIRWLDGSGADEDEGKGDDKQTEKDNGGQSGDGGEGSPGLAVVDVRYPDVSELPNL